MTLSLAGSIQDLKSQTPSKFKISRFETAWLSHFLGFGPQTIRPWLIQPAKHPRRCPLSTLNSQLSTLSAALLCLLLLCGCATSKPAAGCSRQFQFRHDTFAYANELIWDYHIDPDTGQTTHLRHQPPPRYAHHCFVLARAARQFFQHARFDPALPQADDDTYRRLVRRVVSLSPRRQLRAEEKVPIPGYASLHEFSLAKAHLLQAESGGAWQSYLQRGHWRMIFPLSRKHQARLAQQLVRSLDANIPPVVHIVRFPKLSINHALVLFAHQSTASEVRFMAYDPNLPEAPVPLIYNRAEQRFNYPPNHYFAGGRVDLYEVYHAWNY